MVIRSERIRTASRLLGEFPTVALIGARQTGKTTLAQQIGEAHKGDVHHYDIESPTDRNRLADPMLTLETQRGLIVLDEIQLCPDLFPVLRVLADRRPQRARFLVLGSAAPAMLRQSSETLAGRIAYLELEGFSLREVGADKLATLWYRGGLPRSFLSRSHSASGR